jgi:hypothetical protein
MDKILNPTTGKYVKKSSALGKKISNGFIPPVKPCNIGKIKNPKTNRCVKENGKLGKFILSNPNSYDISVPIQDTSNILLDKKNSAANIIANAFKAKLAKKKLKEIKKKEIFNELENIFNQPTISNPSNPSNLSELDNIAAFYVDKIKKDYSNPNKIYEKKENKKINKAASTIANAFKAKKARDILNEEKLNEAINTAYKTNAIKILEEVKAKKEKINKLNPPIDVLGKFKLNLKNKFKLNPIDVLGKYKKKTDRTEANKLKPPIDVLGKYKANIIKTKTNRIKLKPPIDILGFYNKKIDKVKLKPPIDVLGKYKTEVNKLKPPIDILGKYKTMII